LERHGLGQSHSDERDFDSDNPNFDQYHQFDYLNPNYSNFGHNPNYSNFGHNPNYSNFDRYDEPNHLSLTKHDSIKLVVHDNK
jgi:hypothetical protein